jgi:small subunit ribosomal protein S6
LRHLIVKLKKAEVEPSIMMKEVQREEARKVAQADAPAAAY